MAKPTDFHDQIFLSKNSQKHEDAAIRRRYVCFQQTPTRRTPKLGHSTVRQAKLARSNGCESFYGSLDITRDKIGQHALALKALIDQVAGVLISDPTLLQLLPPVDKTKTVRNPFN